MNRPGRGRTGGSPPSSPLAVGTSPARLWTRSDAPSIRDGVFRHPPARPVGMPLRLRIERALKCVTLTQGCDRDRYPTPSKAASPPGPFSSPRYRLHNVRRRAIRVRDVSGVGRGATREEFSVGRALRGPDSVSEASSSIGSEEPFAGTLPDVSVEYTDEARRAMRRAERRVIEETKRELAARFDGN